VQGLKAIDNQWKDRSIDVDRKIYRCKDEYTKERSMDSSVMDLPFMLVAEKFLSSEITGEVSY
jgi:hypothetical protein